MSLLKNIRNATISPPLLDEKNKNHDKEEDLDYGEKEEKEKNQNSESHKTNIQTPQTDSNLLRSIMTTTKADDKEAPMLTKPNDKYWCWHGKGSKRNGKGRARKQFYKCIRRDNILLEVSNC